MLIVNVPKILCYLLLIGVSIWGNCPWWVVPGLVLYDLYYPWVCKLPWVKFPPPGPKGMLPEGEISLEQLLQLRATIEKQNGKVIH